MKVYQDGQVILDSIAIEGTQWNIAYDAALTSDLLVVVAQNNVSKKEPLYTTISPNHQSINQYPNV
jgi:hypothetical protein